MGNIAQTGDRDWRGGRRHHGSQDYVGFFSMSNRNIIVLFIAVFLFAPLMWMLLDRDPPYKIESVEISPPAAKPGDDIEITFSVIPLRPAACGPGLVYREFKEEPSGKLHVYDPIQRATPPIFSENKFTRMARLADNITPGPTIYRGRSCYTCNPLQSWLRWPVCVKAPETPFTVGPK